MISSLNGAVFLLRLVIDTSKKEGDKNNLISERFMSEEESEPGSHREGIQFQMVQAHKITFFT